MEKEKISYGELVQRLEKFNADHGYRVKGNPECLYGVVVIKPESFTKEYTEIQRSYRISSDNKAFLPDQISNSIFSDCLDGQDLGVRLDWYLHDGWEVDYCYIEDDINS